jgi:hypothetical protein
MTLDNLYRHLDRHGPVGVMEAARDEGWPLETLCLIQERIDARTPRVKHRKTVEARVRSWLGLPEEETEA